ncbi:MAG: MaoC/PaaZ C-terminal domain-containing protein [Acidimicrobiales bacterium]|nr:MaoC/PaaZ C-terminal domain-containing protein [Acidimicrobiales bacterium]MDP6299642.1 MaoC/PaaZ C-terminal domain-containing protein [Acidimicrobiales bacterium]HJM28798.1 MaoC/PaaZ C-terminal domain-containing protein [Acidimicrobiales bacterium]HJM98172.1 MaoC/PaaZ C-terminal domain-containing protein [Acidimicrobiales bacterium]
MSDLSSYIGFDLPTLEVNLIDPQKMKTMAALLRDPYPVHWDQNANESLGFGNRVINQGPLNLSYIANMLMEWQGPTCIKRLKAKFLKPVFDGETVVAGGKVLDVLEESSSRILCQIWLSRGDEIVLTGEAEIIVTKEETD